MLLMFSIGLVVRMAFMAIVAVLIVLCLASWAFRNFRALGGAVWTRSNIGLELQLSNNDRALADAEVNMKSPDFPHPYKQLAEGERHRQLGELNYMKAKKKETLAWIQGHPAKFLQLIIKSSYSFLVPPCCDGGNRLRKLS